MSAIPSTAAGNARLWRSRWAAVGAAVAVTLGAGGLITAQATGSEPSVFVAIDPVRVLDTRTGAGLTGTFLSDTPRPLRVTGTIPIVNPDSTIGSGTPVPTGATAIVANVTAVRPSTAGYISVRPATATGEPTTSNVNFTQPDTVTPNSVTVAVPTTGPNAGKIQLWFHGTGPTATTNVAVDIVGYYVAGGAGPRGLSAWDTMPSGQTVVGEFNFDSHGAPLGSSDEFFVAFPAVSPVAVDDDGFVSFGTVSGPTQFSDFSAACTGTAEAPTAPPGRVCIYPHNWDGVNQAATGGYTAWKLRDHGFTISVVPFDTSEANMYLYATWAYTAP
jgi:hypothetical protein